MESIGRALEDGGISLNSLRSESLSTFQSECLILWTKALWLSVLLTFSHFPQCIFMTGHTLFIFLIKVSGWNQESQQIQGLQTNYMYST